MHNPVQHQRHGSNSFRDIFLVREWLGSLGQKNKRKESRQRKENKKIYNILYIGILYHASHDITRLAGQSVNWVFLTLNAKVDCYE